MEFQLTLGRGKICLAIAAVLFALGFMDLRLDPGNFPGCIDVKQALEGMKGFLCDIDIKKLLVDIKQYYDTNIVRKGVAKRMFAQEHHLSLPAKDVEKLTNEDAVDTTKLKPLHEWHKCLTKDDLDGEHFEKFIKLMGKNLQMSDDHVDYLLLAGSSESSVDAIEEFVHGFQGSYTFLKYTVQRKGNGNHDIALAIHRARWTLGLDADIEAVAKGLHNAVSQAGVDYDILPAVEQENLKGKALQFVELNNKQHITQAEKDYWIRYYNDRAIRAFHQHCPDSLMDLKVKI